MASKKPKSSGSFENQVPISRVSAGALSEQCKAGPRYQSNKDRPHSWGRLLCFCYLAGLGTAFAGHIGQYGFGDVVNDSYWNRNL